MFNGLFLFCVSEFENNLWDAMDAAYEDDGQPTEYEEWQDFMGGDDWDFGQFDNADY